MTRSLWVKKSPRLWSGAFVPIRKAPDPKSWGRVHLTLGHLLNSQLLVKKKKNWEKEKQREASALCE